MEKKFRLQDGFTLIELITVMVITSFIVIYAAQTTLNSINAYASYSQRHQGLADARHAVDRMAFELLKIKTSDITTITANRIDFTDENGNPANFRLTVNGSQLSLYRNAHTLVDDVNNMTFLYYDADNNELAPDPANIGQVRRIGITLQTKPVDNEGSLSISTTLVPRSFVGYQKYVTK